MNNVKKEKRKCKEDTTHAPTEQNLSVRKFSKFWQTSKEEEESDKGRRAPNTDLPESSSAAITRRKSKERKDNGRRRLTHEARDEDHRVEGDEDAPHVAAVEEEGLVLPLLAPQRPPAPEAQRPAAGGGGRGGGGGGVAAQEGGEVVQRRRGGRVEVAEAPGGGDGVEADEGGAGG